MIELSRTRDGGKDEGTERWAEACFVGNGFRERKGGDAASGGGGSGKHFQCTPFPSAHSNFMESISGEFGLVISGHSLV